jgi:P27 family predicted phage terminase small subunit
MTVCIRKFLPTQICNFFLESMDKLERKSKSRRNRVAPAHAPLEATDRLSTACLPDPNLSEKAKLEWERILPVLVRLGTATVADVRALELCCEALASEKALREVLEVEGLLVQGGSGGMKAHPALKALETTRSQAHRLLSDFGLTPRGRQHIDAIPPVRSENPFAALIKPKVASR